MSEFIWFKSAFIDCCQGEDLFIEINFVRCRDENYYFVSNQQNEFEFCGENLYETSGSPQTLLAIYIFERLLMSISVKSPVHLNFFFFYLSKSFFGIYSSSRF